MTQAEAANLKVVVNGGSIGGLCAGVALRGIGADVQVYEEHPGPMDTRGAGIVVQGDLTNLLRAHHAPELPTTACSIRRYLDSAGGEGRTELAPQQFTSWEAIYTTLRATFPAGRYRMGAKLSGIEQNDKRVVVVVDGVGSVEADLLICADGSNSSSRRILLPEVEPQYAGYVAWRGTLNEAETPGHLLSFFDDAFTFSEARSGGHILVYFIPGENSGTAPGKRRLNWVWYVGVPKDDLSVLLTDRDGHHHHSSLPRGLVPAATLGDLRSRAKKEVHPRLADLVGATPDPFIQAIADIVVPKTLFGRVILLGDAAFVVRPHTAAATAKAAYEATVLATALRRANLNVDAGLRSAETLQIEQGKMLSRYGVALGEQWAAKL
jgi:2-polyprenyl-6-methoxyphenol hydroxylase-like FAD-dependent oxidoreductase